MADKTMMVMVEWEWKMDNGAKKLKE